MPVGITEGLLQRLRPKSHESSRPTFWLSDSLMTPTMEIKGPSLPHRILLTLPHDLLPFISDRSEFGSLAQALNARAKRLRELLQSEVGTGAIHGAEASPTAQAAVAEWLAAIKAYNECKGVIEILRQGKSDEFYLVAENRELISWADEARVEAESADQRVLSEEEWLKRFRDDVQRAREI